MFCKGKKKFSRGKKWRHSLSAKLVGLFLVTGFLFVILLGFAIKKSYQSSFQESIRPHLMAYLDYVQNDIGLPPDLEQAKYLSEKLSIDIVIIGADIRWSSSGQFIPMEALHVHRTFIQEKRTFYFAEFDELDVLVVEHGQYRLFFTRFDHHWSQQEWHFNKALPFLVFIAVLLFLYHATARIFAPLKQIEQGISEISKGNLEHKITVLRKDELGKLANHINAMGDDIKQMLEAKRQLLLAISHELRTPLTRAKLQAEMVSDPQQSEEIKSDLNEMADLIEELLESERLNNHQSLNRERFHLQSFLPALIKERFANKGIQVYFPDSNIELYADKTRLRLLFKNLLENALRFTSENKPMPEIRAALKNNRVEIKVQDYGSGIAQEHLQHLCEPFYRADPSRQRQTGGYGLGLYLCRMIVEAHGGKLKLESEIGKGTMAIIVMPVES